MKTNIIKSALLLLAALSMTLTSCRKDDKEPETDTSSLQQITADENRVSQAADAALNEVNDVISHSGNKSLFWVPCNATVDSSSVVNDTIIYYITYNGLNCHGNLLRTGQLTVHKHVNTPWAQAGCKVYVHFTNFVVTRVSNNKTVTLSGVKVYENVSGGLLKNLGTTENHHHPPCLWQHTGYFRRQFRLFVAGRTSAHFHRCSGQLPGFHRRLRKCRRLYESGYLGTHTQRRKLLHPY
jgi:hypothetical protein